MFRIAVLALALGLGPAISFAQQPSEHAAPSGVAQPEPGHVAPGEAGGEEGPAEAAAHAEGEPHEETIWGPISRAFNSAILVGVLFYFLRQPVQAYLQSRDKEIRNDLVTAATVKTEATAQLADLQRRMAALPGELDALKARGQEEIAAEEMRIEQAAAADRERLLEQTRREIDLQLRIAQRELVEHAANLAVGIAGERIRAGITPVDQNRLVDRYLEQVRQ